VNAIRIELTGPQVGQVAVPDGSRPVGKIEYAGRIGIVRGVEEQKLHTGGILAEEREIHALSFPRSAEGSRFSRENLHVSGPDVSVLWKGDQI
jgi:hypothetical protein